MHESGVAAMPGSHKQRAAARLPIRVINQYSTVASLEIAPDPSIGRRGRKMQVAADEQAKSCGSPTIAFEQHDRAGASVGEAKSAGLAGPQSHPTEMTSAA